MSEQTSDAVLVNIILRNELRHHLWKWRRETYPPTKWQPLTDKIYALVKAEADACGAPPPRKFVYTTIRTWSYAMGIETDEEE